MVTCKEVVSHIRECNEETCRKLWQEYKKVTQSGQKVELLIDEDGLPPFSY